MLASHPATQALLVSGGPFRTGRFVMSLTLEEFAQQAFGGLLWRLGDHAGTHTLA
jgi:hypothetical protein